MKKITLLALVLHLTACASTNYHVGVGVHTTHLDRYEINLQNPVCLIGVEQPVTSNIELFFEHHSGCFYEEASAGYNLFGAKYQL